MKVVTLAIATPNVSNGSHGHWRKTHRMRKRQRHEAWLVTPAHPLPCVVRLVRLSAGTLDDDGLRTALKSIRDGVADRLGIADNDPRVEWRYAQERAAPKAQAVRIELTGAQP